MKRSLCALLSLSLFLSESHAQEKEISTVFSYPKSDPYDLSNLYGFNHAPNVTLLPDGRLLAAWFSGPYEASVHQLILGAYSEDGGRTWGEAQLLMDTPRKSDFDPSFIVKDGKVWMFYTAGRWNRYPFVGPREVELQEVGLDSYRIYVRQSTDSAKTWSEPSLATPERGFCCKNGITTGNGILLLPIYDHSEKGGWHASLLRSEDDGKTWNRVGKVQAAEGKAGGEPTIAELNDGSILMAMRSRDGKVWFSRSRDLGDTWEEPFASNFVGAASSHALYRMKDGRVILIYNESEPPKRSPLVIRVLDQDNMTWGEPYILAEVGPAPEGDNAWSRQVSYPSATELSDGTLVVVWTEITIAPDKQSGKIQSARIKL